MKTYLKEYRDEFLDHLLDILWDQWTALGISGRGCFSDQSVIDPEAILLFSCSVARYDARLFDAILEWLKINGRFINVARITQILKNERFSGKRVLQTMVAASSTSELESKWRRLIHRTERKKSEPEILFYSRDGNALPVIHQHDSFFEKYGLIRDAFDERGVSKVFNPERSGNLLLRLRAFFGVNARCEIILYLLLIRRGSPRSVARDCYYYPATISKALAEMEQSGLLISRSEGRYRFYEFRHTDDWKSIFRMVDSTPSWIVWPRLFSALEQVWLFLDNNYRTEKSALEQASSLRRLLKDSVISQLDKSGLPFVFSNSSMYLGEDLIPHFLNQIRDVIDWLQKD